MTEVGASSDSMQQQKRLHITDRKNQLCFLADTGADISLLPRYIRSM